MRSVGKRRNGTSLGANPAFLGCLYHSLEDCHVAPPILYETQPFVILQACDQDFQISTLIILRIVGNRTTELLQGWVVFILGVYSQEVGRGTYPKLSEPLLPCAGRVNRSVLFGIDFGI